jgi:hypothetical protein
MPKNSIPLDTQKFLRRAEAARALTEAGFPTAKATLATLASRGGGPHFQRYGRTPLYRYGDLLKWAESKLKPPIRSINTINPVTKHPYSQQKIDYLIKRLPKISH